MIFGDAKGNNTLCAHFIPSQSKQLCHECGVLLEETDDPYIQCHCFTQQKLRIWLRKMMGRIWKDSPSTPLRTHSGIFYLVAMDMVCTSTVFQNNCIPSREAFLHYP